MTGGAVRLGVDFGTSTTIAMVSLGDRDPRPLLFDGSPLLPSAVCVDSTGRLVVGRDALFLAVASPASVEPHPKRCVDDGTVLLGGHEVAVEALFGAVLGRAVDEAERLGDGPATEIVLTHPAAWGAERRAVLERAAPPGALLVPEPVAAAHAFAARLDQQIPSGRAVLVYDLGAGTFDASVVQRTDLGFAVLATHGLPDAGGLDIDAALVAYLRAELPDDARWARLTEPAEAADRRASRQLWDNARSAKEMLSRSTSTLVHVPLFDIEVPLGREQLERLAAPIIDRSIEVSRGVLGAAGVAAGDLAAIMLAGGASRMPAISTALHRAFHVVPSIVDQPELAVAEGSLRAIPARSASPGGGESAPDDAWPPPQPVGVPPSTHRPHTRAMLAAALAAVLLAILVVVLANRPDDGVRSDSARPTGAGSSPTASPTPSLAPGIDPCLIGTWRRVTTQVYGILSNVRVQYTGGGGALLTFRDDGTTVADYNSSAPIWVNFRGARWEVLFRGTITSKYHASDGAIRWSNVQAQGSAVLTRNGAVDTRGALEPFIEASNYVCNGTSYSESSSMGTYVSEYSRVTASSAPAGPAG